MATTPQARLTRRISWIVMGVAVVAAATVAVGLILRLGYGKLGAVNPPFVAGWLPQIDPLGTVVAVLAAGTLVFISPWFVRARLPAPAVMTLLFLLTLGAGLALNVAREGTSGWTHIFDLAGGTTQGHAINEYLPGLPTLDYGVRNYLDRFAEVVPSQSVNIAGHPPGPLLLAHRLGATEAGSLATLVILIGSLCAPLTYRLAWTLSGDERTGRIAGLLCVASPLTLLFGVTSFDYAFAAFATLAACGLAARSWGWRSAGALALSVAALMSWALLAIGAWAVLLAWQRDGLRVALTIGVLCGVAVAALQGYLAARYGYDPIGTLRATEQVYRDSLAQVRPYAFWVFGSPVAWGLMLGPLIVVAVLRGAVFRSPAALALIGIILIAAVGGFSKAETERIWLFMVPLACAAAAPWIAGRTAESGPPPFAAPAGSVPPSTAAAPGESVPPNTADAVVSPRRLRLVLMTLVGQALVFTLLMNTVW